MKGDAYRDPPQQLPPTCAEHSNSCGQCGGEVAGTIPVHVGEVRCGTGMMRPVGVRRGASWHAASEAVDLGATRSASLPSGNPEHPPKTMFANSPSPSINVTPSCVGAYLFFLHAPLPTEDPALKKETRSYAGIISVRSAHACADAIDSQCQWQAARTAVLVRQTH